VPTYEYECSLCNHLFERKQRFDEEAVAMCPECQGKSSRVIHSVPVIFKGSGFYITDNRKSSDIKETKETKEKKPDDSKQKEQVGGESATTASL